MDATEIGGNEISLNQNTEKVTTGNSTKRKTFIFILVVALLIIGIGTYSYFKIKQRNSSVNSDESTNYPPKVNLTTGTLTGIQLEEAQAFYSIPYGKPPLSELRFKDPIAIGSHGDLDVSNNTGVGCIGIPVMCSIGQCAKYESEDCLYLNVYVPNSVDLKDVTQVPSPQLDVIVWFHGGCFFFGAGTAPLYDGRYVANVTRTIVISANYRILPFGFLAMNGEGAPKGNMGFRDQQLVLQWVQDNIQAFGGNKGSVTVFGESAGAQSVGLHLMSNKSEPLFHRAIMESNPVSFMFKTLDEAEVLGDKLAKRSGCLMGNWNCFKNLPTLDIVKGFLEVMVGNMALRRDLYAFLEPYAPIIDGIEFKEQEIDAFKNEHWQKHKSFIIGTNSEELYLVSSAIPFEISYEMLVLINDIIWTNISTKVTELYAPDKTLKDYRNNFGDELTHFAFTCSSRALARYAEKSKKMETNIYYYKNYHPLGDPDCEKLLGPLKSLCGTTYHSSELSFVWRTGPLINQTYTKDEKSYVNAWSNYIGNFAISGNPNTGIKPEKSLGDFAKWPTYTNTTENDNAWLNMALDAPYPFLEKDQIDEFCNFWDGIGYHYPIMWQDVSRALDKAYTIREKEFEIIVDLN